ncbi:MAG: FlgD immunoglobulin-like domain containing protein [bacterium]
MRIFAIVALLGLSAIVSPTLAQQTNFEENELLRTAISIPEEVGVYRNMNSLPESIRKSKIFARGLQELRHHAGSDGFYDAEARLRSIEQTQNDIMRSVSISDKVAGSKLPVFANAWTNIGPTNSAGMTKALAFDPTNSNIIYAGAIAGGVWKTVNAGTSWTPLTDLVIPDLAVCTIAIDPNNASVIYAGSGDPSVATDGYPGSGLYKSADGGATWARLAPTKLGGTINKVLVDPNNSNIVIACAYNNNPGIYRSVDAGVTFTKVFPATKNADGIIWDVAAAQVIGGKQLLYGVEGNNPFTSSAECGVYKSADDGATWIKISNGGLPAGSLIGKAALAIPNSDKTKVYCFMAAPDGSLQGLYKSTNSGISFTSIGTVPSSIFDVGSGPQGWYDLYLAITPSTTTNDTLYIGGIEGYRSFNSGTTWTAYSSYQINGPHVDQQSIAIDPANSRNIFIGTDGGVYRSTNAGVNWAYRSNGFATMRFYHIALDAKDNLKTYGGAQDQGTWKVVTAQSPAYIFGGDGFQPIVDPTNSNIIYAEVPFGDVWKSTNGGSGNSWSSISATAFDQQSSSYENSDWETPFVMAPKSHLTIFEGRERLWRSIDAGSTWGTASNFFTYSGNTYIISTIGLSPANASYYFVGLHSQGGGGGKIQMTSDGGTNWSDKSTGIPSVKVLSIVCHPTDVNFALAGFESWSTGTARVMKTINGGATWTNASGSVGNNLPGVPVNCIAIDSTDPKNVWYAATDNGMYYTRDGGATWGIAGSGIGLAPCVDVQVHANKVTLRVGTHGRSMYEANVNVLPVELTGLSATKTSAGTSLAWKTASEHDDSGFWVQRSFNYQPFEDISFVQGAGNSSVERSYNYLDPKQDNGYYIYRLNQVDLDGSSHLSNIVEVRYGSDASALRLDQNFPNPFNAAEADPGSTRIRFQLDAPANVTMKIYSTSGAVVRTLLNHEARSTDEQNVFWDGKDDLGIPVASGTYFYRLTTDSGGDLMKKMILLGK